MNSTELIQEFLKARLGIDAARVTPDASLVDLGVDSFMLLELMFEFEDRLGVKLPDDLETPKTVGEMLTMMDTLRAAQKV